MRNLPRARFTAAVSHALLFAITSVLMWISSRPILDGPARLPFGVLWVADLPISAIAFSVMFTSTENGWFAWGDVGSCWNCLVVLPGSFGRGVPPSFFEEAGVVEADGNQMGYAVARGAARRAGACCA